MSGDMKSPGLWHGFVPPQYVFANRQFKHVVLDPPDFEPGSWVGAGKVIFDHENGEFLLTARPRKAEGGVRGFAANVYRSDDGEKFELVSSLSKEEISEKIGLKIHSIEGTQLLKDPFSRRWHFYLSVDTGSEFVWGGLYWQTLLMTASNICGPWQAKGFAIKNDRAYDANQARDAMIDIVDGMWFCLYKAMDGDRRKRPALATSSDGISWKKHGVFTIDGTDQFAFLSGGIFAGTNGPLFMGIETGREEDQSPQVYADEYRIGHGAGPAPSFVAYNLDYRNMNLESIFRSSWEALSEYEYKEHPLLGYASLVYDPLKNRILIYVEAIDGKLTKQIGLNETVEKLIMYESRL